MVLDELRTAGESGHLSDHNSLHDFYNAAVDAGAFDEATGTYKDTYPYLIDVDVMPTAISHVNWDTITALSNTVDIVYGGVKASSGAQNDEINWDLVLGAGTWTVELVYRKLSSGGIYHVKLEDSPGAGTFTDHGQIDSYRATALQNERASITGIAVTTPGKHRLKLRMETRNASNTTGYTGQLQHVQLRRTA